MPDYNLAIQVQMDAEDVVSGLQQINDQLSNLPGSVEINFSADDAVTAIMENIQENLSNLPEEYQITISAEDSASEIIDDIKSSLEDIQGEVSTTITAEDNASDTIENIQAALESIGEEYNITITAEDNASEIIENIMSNLEENTYTISIQADDEASDTIENIKSLIESLPTEHQITITAEDEASDTIEDIKSALESIPEELSTVIHAEDEASPIIDEVSSKLEEIDGKEVTATITAEDNASDAIDEVSSKLEEIDGKDVTATISVEGGEEAANETDALNLSMGSLGKTAASVAGTIASYKTLVTGLDYTRAIEMAQEYTNATEEQKKAMEELVQENMSAQLGIAGTAQVMTLLARYTGNANEAMGYFKAVMDAIKVTGEDSTEVTITLMNTFREFNVTTEESYNSMARLIQLFNISGYPSFTQFLDVVDRIGLTLTQMGFSLEDVGAIVASVGPQGVMILRGFTTQLYELNSEWVRGTDKAKEYADKLEKIGIATRDTEGNMRPLRDVIFDFISYLEKLPSHEERVKVATEVFGDTMGRALVAIAEGHGRVEKASERSAEQQVKDIKRVKKETLDPLTRIRAEIEKMIPGIASLTPILSELATWLLKIGSLLALIDTFITGGRIAKWTRELAGKLLESISERLPEGIREGFKSLPKVLADEIKKIGDFGAEKFTEFAKRLGSTLKVKLPSETGSGISEGLKSFGKTLREEILNAGDKAVGYLDDFAGKIRPYLSRLFKDEGGVVRGGWIDDLARVFGDALGGLESRLPSIISKIGPKLGEIFGSGLGRSILSGLSKALGAVGIVATIADVLVNTEDYVRGFFEEMKLPATISNMMWGWLIPEIDTSQIDKWEEDAVKIVREHWQDPLRRELSKFWDALAKGITPEGFAKRWDESTRWIASHMSTFRWPELPKLSIPDFVSEIQSAWSKFTGWVAGNIPRFSWPSLPRINLPDLPGMMQSVWAKFASWVASSFASFSWPHLPKISLPDMVGMIQSAWSKFTGWVFAVFPMFRWPRLPNISLPNLVAMIQDAWNRFKAWVYAVFPAFKWPRLPAVAMPDLVGAIRSAWSKFTAWVSSTFSKFKWPRLSNVTMPDIKGAFSNAWGNFTSTVSSAFKRFKWPGLSNVAMPDIKGAFSNAWKKFTDTVSDAFRKFRWPSLPLPNFGDIARKFYDWGRDFISNLTKGIWDAMPSLQKALAWIRDHLPHSPPEVGPLSEVTVHSMREWMGSIVKAGEEVFKGFAATIGKVEWPEPPSAIIGTVERRQPPEAMVGKTEVNINIGREAVVIRGDKVDKSTLKDAASLLGDEIVRSVISEGVNIRSLRGV